MDNVERGVLGTEIFEVPRTFDGDRGGRETEPYEAGVADAPVLVGPKWRCCVSLGKRHLPLEALLRWRYSCNGFQYSKR
jgi:hypothetical protein